MVRDLRKEYASKYGYSEEDFKDFIAYRQQTLGYSKSKCELAFDNDICCANCGKLEFLDYDDITYEKVLQCVMTKQLYGSLYCKDNIHECWCMDYTTKKEQQI